MKLALCLLFTLFHCQNSYKIVTLPKADEEQHSMKVFFSTKVVDITHKVTTTVTQTAYETCYAAEPGKNKSIIGMLNPHICGLPRAHCLHRF